MNILIISNTSVRKSSTDFLVNTFVSKCQADVLYTQSGHESTTLLDRILYKLNIELDKSNINCRLAQAVHNKRYDLILIIKGNRIYPWTLRSIKKHNPDALLASWSGDNMSKWHNKTWLYHYGVNIYDVVLSVDIPSYRKMEEFCKSPVFYFDKVAHHQIHKPLNPARKEFQYDVLFIGSYEIDRYQTLLFLSKNGIKVHVFGSMWEKCRDRVHANLVIHRKELVGKDYVSAISNAKITLGFLRKINEDTQTSRTFEIPACGGFMLMERTAEHSRLFVEGREAEFFNSDAELLDKVEFYLEHDRDRELIARNGRERVIKDGYSFSNLVDKMIDVMYRYKG